MNHLTLMTVLTTFVTSSVLAQVEVKDPWVRASVPAQNATGAFLELTAKEDARLVAARSPVARTVEIHEMKMEGVVMKMRAIPGLDLPAGKPVALTPSGYHIMLLGLKSQVKVGDSVPLTLVVETREGKQEIEVNAQVKPLGEAHGHHHH
ncbi:copper chaperone PCu(A)C [Sulfuricystis thermophila]|uniref:copper chaperone PCu(A)C n=1 Tax=Sulfuricystis thermophila TaxID=2496847 RepID=UPI001035EFB2|nr:copper chaperone PCu(A)C [Sulfuricystis thermophila]